MELASAKQDLHAGKEDRCVLCTAPLTSGYLCESCERRGLNSRQYAEFFWDEA